MPVGGSLGGSAQELFELPLEPVLFDFLLRKLPHRFCGEVVHGALPGRLYLLQTALNVSNTPWGATPAPVPLPVAPTPLPVAPVVPVVPPAPVLGGRRMFFGKAGPVLHGPRTHLLGEGGWPEAHRIFSRMFNRSARAIAARRNGGRWLKEPVQRAVRTIPRSARMSD